MVKTKTSRDPMTRAPAIFVRVMKFVLIGLLIAAALCAATLKLVERSPEQLKVGFESYLTQASGYPAEIGELVQARFFPDVVLHMRDIRFHAIRASDPPVITAAQFDVRLPFWSLLINRPRFDVLQVRHITLAETVTGAAAVRLDEVRLDPQNSAAVFSGSVGDVQYDGALPLEQHGSAFSLPAPPWQASGHLKAEGSEGRYTLDITRRAGAAAQLDFKTYDPQAMQDLWDVIAARLAADGRDHQTYPVGLKIEALAGDGGGPYVFEQIRLENGQLQPMRCFYTYRGQGNRARHPCAP